MKLNGLHFLPSSGGRRVPAGHVLLPGSDTSSVQKPAAILWRVCVCFRDVLAPSPRVLECSDVKVDFYLLDLAFCSLASSFESLASIHKVPFSPSAGRKCESRQVGTEVVNS